MEKGITRRHFLKGGMAAACSVAATVVPQSAQASPAEKQLTTLFDLSKCTGCGSCVEACRDSNASKFPNPTKPYPEMIPKRVPVMDWSDRRDVDDRFTPYNWLFVQEALVEHDGTQVQVNIPRRCMHCVNPPCVKLCPWGAAKQEKNGLSRIDSKLCLGGSKCKSVCPWKVPQRQTGVGLYLDILPSLAGNGVMYKCDRCYDKLQVGETPACIDACPEEVQSIGPRDEILKEAHRLAREMNGYIYGENENGGTNTIYVSQVPFEKIDPFLEKGKGKPGLNPVEDSMADGNNIAKAMLVAPLAGVAAAIGKIYYGLGQTKNGGEQK